METMLKFRVNYDGYFYLNKDNEVCYRKGKQHSYVNVDPDLLSKVVIENMFIEDIGLSGIREIWFLYPGKRIDDGIRLLSNDISVMECASAVGKQRMMILYVIQGNEASPTDLRKQSPISQPNSQSVVIYNPLFEDLTQNPTQDSPLPTRSELTQKEKTLPKETTFPNEIDSEGASESGGSDDEVLGGESSSEGSDFHESDVDDEDLFEDDELDKDIVEEDIDDGGVFLKVGDTDGIEDPLECDDSDELKSLSDSDGGKKRYPHFNALIDFKKKIVFKSGMIFGSNKIFRKAMRQYSIENGGDYYYLHNDKKKVSAYCRKRCKCPMVHGRIRCVCSKVLCAFKVCARKMDSDGSFQLKSFQGKHECGWQHKNTKVTSEWLAERYLEYHRDDPTWKLSAFISAVKRNQNVHINYTHAWKARLRAMLISQGDCTAQYARVFDYAMTVLKYNSGSSVFVKVNNENPQEPVFERLYMCLEACKHGFLQGCRPIIGVDGCHLKGAYSGQVLVAVGMDGNDNLFPIAYAVVEAERKDTWLWFIELLLRDVGSCNPTFISDRQKVC